MPASGNKIRNNYFINNKLLHEAKCIQSLNWGINNFCWKCCKCEMLNIMKCQSIRSLQCIQYMEKCYYLYLANVFRYHISPFSLAFWQLLFPLDCKEMQKYTRTISFFKVLISMRYSFSMLINHLYFTLNSESDGKSCLLFCQMNFISKLRLTLWNAYVSSNMIEGPFSQTTKNLSRKP